MPLRQVSVVLFVLTCLEFVAPAISASPFDLTLFKDTYQESRDDFLKIASEVGPKNVHTFVFKKSVSMELAVDYVYLPAQKNHKTLILVNSGIHGVEGFVGSAVQRQWLRQLKESPLPSDVGVLMIHGLNPFGFQNQRRVNENNIDLNRNFAIKHSLYAKENNNYQKIGSFLNPENPVHLHFLSHFMFLVNSAKSMLRYSLSTIRQGILEGQYSFPNGISYGGDRPQNQRALIDLLLLEWASSYERIFVIDLHTGYGQRGKLHYLAASSADPKANELTQIFGEKTVDFGRQEDFYLVEGDLVSYCLYRLRNDFHRSAHGLGFEFGTLDSQKVFGGIESLRRMVLENQNWQYGSRSQEDALEVRHLFLQMFYPSEPAWRLSALTQAQEGWDKVLDYFSKH